MKSTETQIQRARRKRIPSACFPPAGPAGVDGIRSGSPAKCIQLSGPALQQALHTVINQQKDGDGAF
ncbi:MAG: hypothetical protein HY929_04180 [Euryarchaeota archaeon]|nr:hypothetical protein [Euryarchaeota archaeon]